MSAILKKIYHLMTFVHSVEEYYFGCKKVDYYNKPYVGMYDATILTVVCQLCKEEWIIYVSSNANEVYDVLVNHLFIKHGGWEIDM